MDSHAELQAARRGADLRLCESLLYLLERSEKGGLTAGRAAGVVQETREDLARYPAKMLRACAFEVHHLLHLALSDGDANQAVSAISSLSAIGALTTEDMIIRGFHSATHGRNSEDRLFLDVIQPEYLATTGSSADIRPPTEQALSNARLHLSRAIGVLGDYDKRSYSATSLLVSEVTVLASETIKAGTSIQSFGRVWFGDNPEDEGWLAYAEMLVHEVAHLELYLYQLDDPLLLNGSEDGYTSPFRPDPRPLSGIYHALFVLTRNIESMRLLAYMPENDSRVECRLTRYTESLAVEEFVERFWVTERIIRDHARLTAAGEDLLRECVSIVRSARA